jgi:UDP-N-acetylglucosamine 4-epimerase
VRDNLVPFGVPANTDPEYRDFRAGDVRHSLADTQKVRSLLGYEPTHDVSEGIKLTTNWYVRNLKANVK